MGEALNGLKRTMMCGEPREINVGEKITLMGWVQRNRKLGGLQFIDLRDRTGIMQIVFGEEINAESFEKAKAVRPEYCIAVTGEVVLREAPNAAMETGMVELKCESIKVLSESETPPIYIKEGLDAAENIRLKYRYLDLRRPDMQKIFMIRNRATKAVRDYLDNNGFLEIETPILNKSTPEGARDYLVPSRNYPGMFYALPQSPQIFKQLLMVSGFEKYYQIAPCFRDEDARSDRLYGEFYQLDLEMAYVSEEDVLEEGKKIFKSIFKKFGNKKISSFKVLTYKESMEWYGTDKPDLRNPLKLVDVSKILVNSSFAPFRKTIVKSIVVRGIADKSNSWFNEIVEYAKEIGMPGIGYFKIMDDLSFNGPIDKFLSDDERNNLIDHCNLERGDVIFFIADRYKAYKYASLIRDMLGKKMGLIDDNIYSFCIIKDFPMYEFNIDNDRYV